MPTSSRAAHPNARTSHIHATASSAKGGEGIAENEGDQGKGTIPTPNPIEAIKDGELPIPW